MPKLTATVQVPKFDTVAYTKAVLRQIELQMKQAARAFVRAAVSRIPVDTGMAAGSFLNLGTYLRKIGLGDNGNLSVRTYIDVNRKHGTGKYYHSPGSAGNPIPKNEDTPGNYDLVTKNVDVLRPTSNGASFQFQSSVYHLTLNDLIGSKGTGPWHSFEYGQAAFLLEMRGLKSRLPRVGDYITKTAVTLGANNGLSSGKEIRVRRQKKER